MSNLAVATVQFQRRRYPILNDAGVQRHRHIHIDQLTHDIAVLDTAIYFNKLGVSFSEMETEKQLHAKDGFSNRKHRPDFVYTKDAKEICVEVELSLKSKDRFEANIKANFSKYDEQIWIVPDSQSKIARFLEELAPMYTNIKIIELAEVKGIV